MPLFGRILCTGTREQAARNYTRCTTALCVYPNAVGTLRLSKWYEEGERSYCSGEGKSALLQCERQSRGRLCAPESKVTESEHPRWPLPPISACLHYPCAGRPSFQELCPSKIGQGNFWLHKARTTHQLWKGAAVASRQEASKVPITKEIIKKRLRDISVY